MASSTTRYLRYILFAVFGLTVIYVISSASTQQFPSATGIFNGDVASPGATETDSPKPGSESSSASSPQSEIAKDHDTVTPNPPPSLPPPAAAGERMNATFVTLARNGDIWEIARSIRQVEDRFNRNYHYDWVFLNDKPFDNAFKSLTTALVSGTTYYGEIPKEHWSFPDHIDQDRAAKVRDEMGKKKDYLWRFDQLSPHVSIRVWFLLPTTLDAELRMVLAS